MTDCGNCAFSGHTSVFCVHQPQIWDYWCNLSLLFRWSLFGTLNMSRPYCPLWYPDKTRLALGCTIGPPQREREREREKLPSPRIQPEEHDKKDYFLREGKNKRSNIYVWVSNYNKSLARRSRILYQCILRFIWGMEVFSMFIYCTKTRRYKPACSLLLLTLFFCS